MATATPLYPKVDLHQLEVDVPEMLRYLGYRGQEMEPFLGEMVQRCAQDIQRQATPRAVVMELPCRREGDAILLSEQLTLPGKDIRQHLELSQRCVVMGATLGHQVERLIQYHRQRSMTEAVMLDAAATALIEGYCDALEAALRSQYQQQGEELTDRFSCGYGDLPLSVQPELIRLLGADKAIGLSCSSSLIMIPRKSVTAILGVILPGQRRSVRGCQQCANRETCSFRKEGRSCGHSG